MFGKYTYKERWSVISGASVKENSAIFNKQVVTMQLLIALIPVAALIVSLISKSFLLLDYVHVISGAIWTGTDVFMGVVLARLMRTLNINERVEIAKRLTPRTVFLLPSLAAVTVTAGIYLAEIDGYFNPLSSWVVAAIIVVIILTVQGFAILLPNSVRILLEITKKKGLPDKEKIARLNMINLKLSASQAFFQFVIIFIMANLAVGHP